MMLLVFGIIFIPLIGGILGLNILYVLALYCMFAILLDVVFLLKSKNGIIDLSYEGYNYFQKNQGETNQILTKRKYPSLFALCYWSGVATLVILCIGLLLSLFFGVLFYELLGIVIFVLAYLIVSVAIILNGNFFIPSY